MNIIIKIALNALLYYLDNNNNIDKDVKNDIKDIIPRDRRIIGLYSLFNKTKQQCQTFISNKQLGQKAMRILNNKLNKTIYWVNNFNNQNNNNNGEL